MAEFSVVSDASMALVHMLRENLCPDPVQSPESIQLASPADRNADYHLGVFLYDVREIGEARRSEQVRGADNRAVYPARPLSLHYVLYLNSKAQIASGAEAEQRILGRAMQAVGDNASLSLPASVLVEEGEEGTALSLPALPFEEKSKIWTALNVPYQMGIYCVISPVLLSSRHEARFTRVRSVEIGTRQKRREGP